MEKSRYIFNTACSSVCFTSIYTERAEYILYIHFSTISEFQSSVKTEMWTVGNNCVTQMKMSVWFNRFCGIFNSLDSFDINDKKKWWNIFKFGYGLRQMTQHSREFMVCFLLLNISFPSLSIAIRGCLAVPGTPGVLCLFKAVYRLWTAY